jgi:glutathione synthase/RimK-type ligase-like ATP-grasp enzyme
MILLWGTMEDEPMAMAHAALVRAGADFFFLDHRKIFASEIDYSFSPEGGGRCIVTVGDASLDMDTVKVAYVRGAVFYDYEEMRDRPLDDPVALRAAWFEAQLTAWLDSSDALVINRSGPSATNSSKPYQLAVIRQAGLGIPESFISNDGSAARGFLAEHPESIFKSISGIRSIVRRVSEKQLGFMDDVNWCPTLFQQVVQGTNYRAHVLNGEIYAVRIESDQLDYRCGRSTIVAEDLPPEVAEKCRRLNAMLGLCFTGIGLIRTPDGEWYCFEVSASPGFPYFETGSGQPISTALARLMMEVDADDARMNGGPHATAPHPREAATPSQA